MKGTEVNPINLDLDQADQADVEAKLEQARKKQLFQQAKITKSPFQLCLAAIKSTVKGERKLKNRIVNKAIIQFFQKEVNLDISCGYFQPRRDPNYQNNPINPKQLILYGVDFLSTKMIKDRFNQIDATIFEIKWIDSSTCKLVFETENQAKIVIERHLADTNVLSIKQDSETEQLQGWFTLKNYTIYNFDRSLFLRYSTHEEDIIEKGELNKYKDFQKARNELIHHLFNKFNAFQAYEQAVQQIEKEDQLQLRVRLRNSFPMRRKNERNYERRGQRRSNDRDRSRDENRRHHIQRDQNEQCNNNKDLERRRNNRERRSYEPDRFQGKFNPHRNYENRRAGQNNFYQNNNNPTKLGTARINNVYYDCNGIEDLSDSNLSFEFRQQQQNQHHDQDEDLNLEANTSFKFQKQTTQKNNNSIDQQDLSLIVGNPNNESLELKRNQKADMSFVFQENRKNVEEQNFSFLQNEDNKGQKKGAQEDEDFSMIFGQEQISPVHGFNTSFVVNKQKERTLNNQTNTQVRQQFLDFEKPIKNKQKEIVLDDDDGY